MPHGGIMGKRVTWLKSREDVVFFLYEEIGVDCTMSTLFFFLNASNTLSVGGGLAGVH